MSSTGILHVTLQWINIIRRALSEMCASAGIYGEAAGVAADTGRGKGNDGSEDLPKASDSSFTGK